MVDDFISKVRNPYDDQSRTILLFNTLMGHLASEVLPSKPTRKEDFLLLQLIVSKRDKSIRIFGKFFMVMEVFATLFIVLFRKNCFLPVIINVNILRTYFNNQMT